MVRSGCHICRRTLAYLLVWFSRCKYAQDRPSCRIAQLETLSERCETAKKASTFKTDLFVADHRKEMIDRLGDPLMEIGKHIDILRHCWQKWIIRHHDRWTCKKVDRHFLFGKFRAMQYYCIISAVMSSLWTNYEHLKLAWFESGDAKKVTIFSSTLQV